MNHHIKWLGLVVRREVGEDTEGAMEVEACLTMELVGDTEVSVEEEEDTTEVVEDTVILHGKEKNDISLFWNRYKL